jgi:hypothetical protein
MIVNRAFGMAIGPSCPGLLLAFDFAGVRSLLWRSGALISRVALLCAGFAFTFGGVDGPSRRGEATSFHATAARCVASDPDGLMDASYA